MECELCQREIREDQGYYLVNEKGCCKQCYDLNVKKHSAHTNVMFFPAGTSTRDARARIRHASLLAGHPGGSDG